MYKNIIFDMGGVLIQWNPDQLLDEYKVSSEDRKILFENVFYNYKWNLLDAGYYDKEEDFLKDIYPTVPDHLKEVVYKIVMDFGRTEVLMMPKMPELVERLKQNGYKIYLLSNAGPRHSEYWCQVKNHELFDGVFVSALAKMFKPERLIYKTMLEKYNLKAQESIFIDDLPINCSGAFLSGITPINFKSYEQVVKELRNLGVNC